ncbi:hypothetical protein QUA56_31895 [Microcoleus sp. N3A4]
MNLRSSSELNPCGTVKCAADDASHKSGIPHQTPIAFAANPSNSCVPVQRFVRLPTGFTVFSANKPEL